jgi:hypothetical protein
VVVLLHDSSSSVDDNCYSLLGKRAKQSFLSVSSARNRMVVLPVVYCRCRRVPDLSNRNRS